jgi:NAD-dependent DNA ligase
MLSLGNLFTNEDVERFARPIFEAGDSVIIEPKYDGLSVALHHTLGGLGAAVTRGDGSVGDLVTENVKRVQGVPHQLLAYSTDAPAMDAPTLEVRGEVYMSYPDFEAVNAERAAAGEKLFANPRNAAVGALKSSDPEELARRRLSFVAYDLKDWDQYGVTSRRQALKKLAAAGFESLKRLESPTLTDFSHPLVSTSPTSPPPWPIQLPRWSGLLKALVTWNSQIPLELQSKLKLSTLVNESAGRRQRGRRQAGEK